MVGILVYEGNPVWCMEGSYILYRGILVKCMEESQYSSENSRTLDSLANILADMSAKPEKISRLEKKLEEVTTNFTGELDFLKMEITNLSEARKKDRAELTRLQTSIKGVAKDLQKNEEIQGNIERKVNKIDNT